MALRRLSVLTAAGALAGLALAPLASPSSVNAQDMFNPFDDRPAPPARKRATDEPPRNVLPESVDRGALPDLAPTTLPPAQEGAPPPSNSAQDRDAPPATGPLSPARAPYARSNTSDDVGGYDAGAFDPIEARRNGYRQPAGDGRDRQGWQGDGPRADTPPSDAPHQPAAFNDPGPRRPQPEAAPWQPPPGPPPPPGERHSFNAPPLRPSASFNRDPWSGIAVAEVDELLSRLELPPRSPAVHDLWVALITAEPGPGADPRLAAVRADALNRTGLTREASAALARAGDVASDPVLATLAARTAIGAGDSEQGCSTARSLTSSVAAKMSPHLKGEVILIAGYCAAATDNKAAAGIAADLASENSLGDHAGPEALKALAAGLKPAVAPGKKVSLLDYRILQLAGPVDVTPSIATASPALLAVLARDAKADPASRLAAAEAAASLNAITLDELAENYRASAGNAADVELSDAASNGAQPARRAALFVAAENERSPLRKARYIRAYLDESRRVQLYWPALKLMAPAARSLAPLPEIAWFAETAVEANLAAGDFNAMQRWVEFAGTQGRGADLRHWMALADIADPNPDQSRTQNLGAVEVLAQHERLDPVLLHRLATVLDALDTNVPMPLWEAASRTEQPTNGHLPDTGILSQLQDAGKRRDLTRVVLLVMRTLGPDGAEGAHMIALGDSIRALKRSGLEAEARRLALEAVFAAWPRTVTN